MVLSLFAETKRPWLLGRNPAKKFNENRISIWEVNQKEFVCFVDHPWGTRTNMKRWPEH
jgi:hypothetical protein